MGLCGYGLFLLIISELPRRPSARVQPRVSGCAVNKTQALQIKTSTDEAHGLITSMSTRCSWHRGTDTFIMPLAIGAIFFTSEPSPDSYARTWA